MTPIAYIYTGFDSKFGVPRQSGLIPSVRGRIVMQPEFRVAEAFRGIEDFSHLWLLWDFHEAHREFSPTVRPPMLGGNKRMGVFATRSPFRPNNIGLSCVELLEVKWDDPQGPVLIVGGADMMDGTPILDIKPYLPFTDSHPGARGGFTEQVLENYQPLEVLFPENFALADETLREILAADPRPHYQRDENRVYGFSYKGREIHFRVEGMTVVVLEE